MKGVRSFISTIHDGKSKAYIYIWVSKVEKLVYVGQTNERNGSFGRGYSHIQSNGTLRIRCFERVGIDIEMVSDLTLFSYLLPENAEFISTESAFRLAVEYLVQSKLYMERKQVYPVFQIISNISTTGHTSNSQVKDIASEIVKDFIDGYINT
jgi:hypothetical protein